jgi:hypothetical protein
MTDPDIHDYSRLDAYMRARRRVALLSASWKPLLAGAVASLAVSAAIWVILPKISYREIEVPRVSYKDAEVPRLIPHDVQVDHVIPHDVPIDIPRIVAAPRSAEEFEGSQPFRDANIKGRFIGPFKNGFALDSGQTFVPVRVASGRVELAPDLRDDISRLTIGDPVYCAPAGAESLFECQAWHRGRVEAISVAPAGRPT